MKRQTFKKHVLIANQFLVNDEPVNKQFIDHIDRNKTNNHLSNLRFVSRSENNKNRTGHINKIKYEHFDEIDDNAIAIIRYGKYRFKNYYYVPKEDNFYYFTGLQFRKLHININKNNLKYIYMNDNNNVQRLISLSKFKLLNGFDKK